MLLVSDSSNVFASFIRDLTGQMVLLMVGLRERVNSSRRQPPQKNNFLPPLDVETKMIE